MHLSAAAARRFLVRRHLLAPPRSLPARARSVLAVVRALGSLQFDPLETPGARNHELVLHARVAGYRRGWCERWLYGPDRRLFEAYNKSLNILPVEELPYHRISFSRGWPGYGQLLAGHTAETARILATIAERGPLPSSYFSREINHTLPGGWGPMRAGRLLVEGLFVHGRLAIARRDGNTRFYDLPERVYPAELLARPVEDGAALRHRLLTRFRGVGLLGAGGAAEVTTGTGPAAARRKAIEGLAAEGVLVPVTVEGVRGPRWILAEERPLLDAGAAGGAVTFLGPLDPFLWDRRLVRELFGFDYTWEVYTPAKKRKHGYYVLPILFGDRLVGRIEPRLDREAETLAIAGLWHEASFRPTRRYRAAFDDALEAYRAFVGADEVVRSRLSDGARP
ncbi:MAG TPA: crosslink repair DNA glycosylase YcaQ family protein [Haliangiales bacterium]|nr:crosslink repair DNA glycosylase YcaQ family protein [Haliangiales bacterium]